MLPEISATVLKEISVKYLKLRFFFEKIFSKKNLNFKYLTEISFKTVAEISGNMVGALYPQIVRRRDLMKFYEKFVKIQRFKV